MVHSEIKELRKEYKHIMEKARKKAFRDTSLFELSEHIRKTAGKMFFEFPEEKFDKVGNDVVFINELCSKISRRSVFEDVLNNIKKELVDVVNDNLISMGELSKQYFAKELLEMINKSDLLSGDE